MRITAVHVDGFGVWSGLKLDPLADGLNVFYGPNEAGKSTLMQFVRGILYGFSPERRRFFPPVHGGRPGGSLHLHGATGPLVVHRHDLPGEAVSREELQLFGADGTRQAETQLQAALCNLDETVFNNVFAVGLREVQELATLNDTDAGALLYRLTAGMDRVSLVEVMREVIASRNRLLDQSGGSSQILQLIGERDRLRAEIRDFDSISLRYGQLAAERDQLEREANRLEEESTQLGASVRVLQTAIAVRDRWAQRKAFDAQLAALGPAEKVPEGVVERLDCLRNSLEERKRSLDELKLGRDRVRQEIAELKINAALWRQAPRIEALQEQEQWIGTLESRILELETELADAEQQRKEEQKRFGFSGETFPVLSPQSLAALARPAAAIRRARQEVADAKRNRESSSESAQTLEEQVRTALDSRGETDLREATERVGGLVGQLRRRVQIDERLEQLDRHLAELEEQGQELLERQMTPVSILLGLGAVFIAGAALMILSMIGLIFSKTMLGQLGLPGALVGLTAMIAAMAAKFLIDKSNARKLGTCQRQTRMLQLQKKQAKEERDGLDEQLPKGQGPILTRLQAAERELAELEELVPLDAKRHSVRQEAASADEQAQQAEADLAAAHQRWKDAIGAAGLPKGLSPKQVRELASRRQQLQELQQRLERGQEEHSQRTTELESITGRIAQLIRETGLKLEGKPPAQQLRALLDQLAEQENRLKRRRALRQELRQVRRQRAKVEAAFVKLRRRRRSLLAQLGVRSEEEIRKRAAHRAQVEGLQQQRDSLQREIDAAIAGCCPQETIGELLDGDAARGLEDRRQQLESRLQACSTQLKQRYEKRGQLNEQLRLLTDNRTPGLKKLELGLVEKRLADALQRWKVLAVTGGILEGVRKDYEQTRQPETLQEASGYLERMTQGRYSRVWTPLSDDVLLVDDHDGNSHSVELLSRGSREQLFLCLRMALAGSYARRGADLPMVLDDVLVNFDNHRAKAAVEVLCDFAAAGHQLLVFTCHEHIAKLFQSLDVDVHQLPSHTGPQPAAVAAPAKPPKAKRKRKAPEELPPEEPPKPKPAKAKPPEPAPVVEVEPEPEPPVKAAADEYREPLEELAPWEEDDRESIVDARAASQEAEIDESEDEYTEDEIDEATEEEALDETEESEESFEDEEAEDDEAAFDEEEEDLFDESHEDDEDPFDEMYEDEPFDALDEDESDEAEAA